MVDHIELPDYPWEHPQESDLQIAESYENGRLAGIRQDREEAARSRWLIEAAESEAARPLYWRGSFGDERNLWTYDHMAAVRLARKADAEAIAAGVLRGYAIRICEHVWDGVALSAPGQEGERP